jgi:hypothetical protein
MPRLVRASDLVLVRGMARTRVTLDGWNDRPWPVLGSWLAGSGAIAALLLAAVWIIAVSATADATPFTLPGLHTDPTAGQVGDVLFRNGLVLALHAMACAAGFIAGSSLPLEAERHSGVWRWIHAQAGPLAISAATAFSLVTQAYVLGMATNTLADQLEIPPALLLVGLMPHAATELVALFLPLGRVDHRQPPGRMGPAARRDARDGPARRAGARRLGVRRGLRQPARAALVRRVDGGIGGSGCFTLYSG